MDPTPEQIPHVLACDIGNSAIHFAQVHGTTVSEVQVMRMGELASLGKAIELLWSEIPAPRKLVACSVNAGGLKALEAAAAEALHEPVLAVGRDLPLPMQTKVDEPERLGADRVCAAVAAYDQLGLACVVADFGSAITIDCVNEGGVFLGGAILPGLAMSARALHEQTAQLPMVEPDEATWVFGKNTRDAIVGGLIYGAGGALRELVEAYATELGHWPVVILTGGDARLVAGDPNESGLVQAIVPDLTIRGVAMAYYRTLVK